MKLRYPALQTPDLLKETPSKIDYLGTVRSSDCGPVFSIILKALPTP